ncbi:hypothetical protein PC9H_004531 [Pleurotus ostreatus]|uniref:Transmembrane protein 135 N-terminal domain-containing protein n=1 Tax=Pleurotus ostreatus TaxID=5322 RepID=A0A8H6ZY46_PLEOS|nr:uncharacterized protein PC9H_004531 [Pleurotus ostreatus]KAF7432589.1 hypothetical protein PC9H_004531 [Pleurotus ostreatus]KAJ8698915.1 hypothetical protein PTI98_005574 [Pleurotus ostreatus]
MDSQAPSPPYLDEPANSDSNGSRTPYLSFTPKRSIASFENLVALANYQERLKDARKMVWRDRGQPVTDLPDLKACLEHAATGGLRSATLAFGIRAGLNVVLAMIRMRRMPRSLWFSLVRHAIFGFDTLRFGAMLGTFTAVYKFLINALPILVPAVNPRRYSSSAVDDEETDIDMLESGRNTSRLTVEVPLAERRARLSLSTHAQMMIVRKKTRRWHAALAGAVAGALAIVWEKRNRRGVIAQQMFVRGLQGSYNSFASRHNIHVPHGAVLVFSVACGQILYAFLLRPDTLPRSYSSWIGQAAKVPAECVRMNKDLVREGTFDIADVDKLSWRPDITPSNLVKLLELRDRATAPTPSFGPRHVSCAAVHPAIDSCLSVPFDRFFEVFKWMLPIYGALHFIPAILFKRKEFFRQPLKMLLKAGWGTTRSSAFLGTFVIIYQTAFCYKHYLYDRLSSPKNLPTVQRLVELLISRASFWIPGFLCGLSLFVEAPRRRAELAMYVLPKGLESAWIMARGKGLVFKTGKYGDVMLTAIGMGMFMSTYQNDPHHLSGLVRRIMYQFIGPN